MEMRLRFAILGLVAVVVGSFGVPALTAPSTGGGTLTIAIGGNPFALDPHKDAGSDGNTILKQITENLVGSDDKGNMIPVLAEALPEIPSPVTYVFRLRRGVRFHDGEAFDATAVKYTWDRLMDSQSGSIFWPQLRDFVQSVEVVDQFTVRFRLRKPWPDLLNTMAYVKHFDIVSKKSVEQWGREYGLKASVGTGPFKFQELIKDDRVVLVRNENYWRRGLPVLDRIVYRIILDPSVKLINLRTGQVDVAYDVPLNEAKALQNDRNLVVMSHGSGLHQWISFNTTRPPFNDKRLRQAIEAAIDKRAIVDALFGEFAEITGCFFPSWHWACDSGVKPTSYDADRARRLLQEAGYGPNRPLRFRLAFRNEPTWGDQATLVQAQLAKVGVVADLVPMERGAFFTMLSVNRPEKTPLYAEFQAGLAQYGGGTPEALPYVYYQYVSNGSLNSSSYNQENGAQRPEAERLIQEAAFTTDRAKARQLYGQIARMLQDDVPQTSLSWLANVIAMRTYVKNHPVNSQHFIQLSNTSVQK